MAQLELVLGDPVKRIPWDGQSPRGLTRGAKVLYSKRERGEDDRFFVDPNQGDLFHAGGRGRRYSGAPSLLPL